MARALYRGRQFFRSLRPRVDGGLRSEAFALLGEGERALFLSMTPRDQQHCLEVYRRLRAQGHDDRDLLAAALLHDAGKGRIALWHRVAFVLLEAGAPGLLRRLASPAEGPEWRQALDRCLRHAELGAEAARRAGSSPRTVALIAEDAGGAEEAHLTALKGADDVA